MSSPFLPTRTQPHLLQTEEVEEKELNYNTRLTLLENSMNDVVGAINGGFKNLNENFHEIKTQICDIQTCHSRIEEEIKSINVEKQTLHNKITEINKAVYDPDNGIYRRINESIIMAKGREEKLDVVTNKIDHLEFLIKPIEQTERNLKTISGEGLEELRGVIKTKKTFNNILWIVITAFATGAGMFIWNLITNSSSASAGTP